MVRERFTEMERRVIEGLLCYPYSSDVDIQQKVGVRKSTFSSARNRLLRKGVLRFVRIPNLQLFGMDLMCGIWGNVGFQNEDETRRFSEKLLEALPLAYLICIERDRIFILLSSPSYVDFRKSLSALRMIGSNLGVLMEESVNYSIESLSSCTVERFFQFLPSFNDAESVASGCIDPVEMGRSPIQRVLTARQLEALCHLVHKPNSSDAALARHLNVSEATASSLRRGLERSGAIINRWLLDPQLAGYRIISFHHWTFRSIDLDHTHARPKESVLPPPSAIVSFSNHREKLCLCAFKSFDQYREALSRLSSELTAKGMAMQNSVNFPLSVPGLRTVRACDFGPLVDYILDRRAGDGKTD